MAGALASSPPRGRGRDGAGGRGASSCQAPAPAGSGGGGSCHRSRRQESPCEGAAASRRSTCSSHRCRENRPWIRKETGLWARGTLLSSLGCMEQYQAFCPLRGGPGTPPPMDTGVSAVGGGPSRGTRTELRPSEPGPGARDNPSFSSQPQAEAAQAGSLAHGKAGDSGSSSHPSGSHGCDAQAGRARRSHRRPAAALGLPVMHNPSRLVGAPVCHLPAHSPHGPFQLCKPLHTAFPAATAWSPSRVLPSGGGFSHARAARARPPWPRLSSPSEARWGSSAGQPCAWLRLRPVLPRLCIPRERSSEPEPGRVWGPGLQKASQAQPLFKKLRGKFLLEIQHDTQPRW